MLTSHSLFLIVKGKEMMLHMFKLSNILWSFPNNTNWFTREMLCSLVGVKNGWHVVSPFAPAVAQWINLQWFSYHMERKSTLQKLRKKNSMEGANKSYLSGLGLNCIWYHKYNVRFQRWEPDLVRILSCVEWAVTLDQWVVPPKQTRLNLPSPRRCCFFSLRGSKRNGWFGKRRTRKILKEAGEISAIWGKYMLSHQEGPSMHLKFSSPFFGLTVTDSDLLLQELSLPW